MITRQIGSAMGEQVRRTNKLNADPDAALREQIRLLEHQLIEAQRENARLLAENKNLNRENDALTAKIVAGRAAVHDAVAGSKPMVGGRAVVNQAEAARILNVNQSQISRWVAAGHFSTTPYGKRTLIFADSLHRPAPKKRGKKRTS